MLVSTKTLKESIQNYLIANTPTPTEYEDDKVFMQGASDAMHKFLKVIEDYEIKNSQIEKPNVVFADSEESVILYCDFELWEYVNQIKASQIEDFGIKDFAKIWLKVKKMLKKNITVT